MRIFVSAVTHELEKYRRAAADELANMSHQPVHQDYVTPDDVRLLPTLRDLIAGCDAVVHLIGREAGVYPPPAAVVAVGHSEAFQRLSAFTDLSQASYTQWEYLFALDLGKPVLRYKIAGELESGPAPEGEVVPGGQQAYHDWIKSENVLRSPFDSEDMLRLQLRRTRRFLNDSTEPAPRVLPIESLGELFTGREEDLERLHLALWRREGSRNTAITQSIDGLGGVGKTRLAVEYAVRFQDQYSAVLFISAETPATLQSDLAALADVRKLNLPTEDNSQEHRIRAVLRWLASHPGWLLIIDNADTDESKAAVQQLLPDLQGGQVVITGRIATWQAGVRTLTLDVLSIEQSASFLLARTDPGERRQSGRAPSDDDEAQARALADELDGLALALEQAGAYVSYMHCTLSSYLERWKQSDRAVQQWHRPDIMRYPRSVAATWETTLEQLSPAAVAVLRVCSWLAPEPIPVALFATKEAGAILQQLLETDSFPEAAEVLAELASLSMVTWAGQGQSVLVHRVVQHIIRTRMDEPERLSYLQAALDLLHAYAPEDAQDVRHWPVWDVLLPHVRGVLEPAEAAGIPHPTDGLMHRLGRLFRSRALYPDAERYYRRGLELAEARLGPTHEDLSTHINGLALVLKITHRLDDAEALYRRALAIDEATVGPNDPHVAILLNNLARLLHDSNRLAEAEPLLRRAVAIDEVAFGPDHPEVATDLNNLACLLRDTNLHADAEHLFRRALTITEAALGPDHPTVGIRLNNLARLLQDTNRLSEAEPLFRRALAIDEASLGPDHPTVATNLNNLAGLLQATNRLSEAEPLSRRSVRILLIFQRDTGFEHPNLRVGLANYRSALLGLGRSPEEIDSAIEKLAAEVGVDLPQAMNAGGSASS